MKQIQLVDLSSEHLKIKGEITDAITQVIADGDFVSGKSVSEFEFALGNYLGAEVVGVGNGTDAITVAIMALGLVSGDEVILPSFTYYATAEAIVMLGIIPVFVDIQKDSFTIRAKEINDAITSRTKAVIVVHIYGQPAEMIEIMNLCSRNSLYLIEDAAQAIGAYLNIENKKRYVSTIGDVGTLSFFPGKNLGAFGDGGAIVTKNPKLAQKIKMIRNHGQVKRYIHDVIGMNSRLDSIQAAILSVKLKYLEDKNSRRIEIARYYVEGLANCPNITLPHIDLDRVNVFHQFTIKVSKGLRDDLQAYLFSKMIPTRIYYPVPVHKQKGMKGKMRIHSNCDISESTSLEVLSLPIHPELDDIQLDYIVLSILEFNTIN